MVFFLPQLHGQEKILDSLPQNPIVVQDSISIRPPARINDSINTVRDSLSGKAKFLGDKEKKEVVVDTATIDMYRILQHQRSMAIDTSLTIQKDYVFNYLRKDYFELLPFVNMGHAFNRLGHDFIEKPLRAQLGARSKHYVYTETHDTRYYEVPTPLTEMFFKTTLEQGQLADVVIAVNTSPQFNFALNYRGMRSLGKYVNQRSNTEATKLSFTYKTKNERYKARAHYTAQLVENQENGGITADGIVSFQTGDPDFLERSVLPIRLRSAENTLNGKRSHFYHQYSLAQPKDSMGIQWTLGQSLTNETKFYAYNDSNKSSYFGERLNDAAVNDWVKHAYLNHRIETHLKAPFLGELRVGIENYKSQYFFRETTDEVVSTGPDEYEISPMYLNAQWNFTWKGFDWISSFNKTLSGTDLSDCFSTSARFTFPNKGYVLAKFDYRNRMPDFNFIRYKSAYTHYNWYNPNLENEKIAGLTLQLSHPVLGTISGNVQRLENYTHYLQSPTQIEEETQLPIDQFLVSVQQAGSVMTYLKVRYEGHYTFLKKFALTNTAQYQNVSSASDELALNVPEWNLRSTLSFSSDLFKKALFMQAGVTGTYFTKFTADTYNPLLGDFVRQNDIMIGDFPRVDVFVNAKIQQTRLYLKYEHLNASFTGYDYFSAPNYPYRDGILRFGLVWNFFQ